MHPDDAKTAQSIGVDGIIVSNHGGRQFSSVPGIATVFPQIRDVVSDRVDLFFDGGIRREDIVKAHTLEASAVLRTMLVWGLAQTENKGHSRNTQPRNKDTLSLIGERK